MWASKENSNDFAIRESATSVKVYKNFVEKTGGLDVGFQADGLTGGVLLGVRGQGGISFFDWQSGSLVRRIEVDPKQVCLVLPRRLVGADLDLAGLLVRKRRACCAGMRRYVLRPAILPGKLHGRRAVRGRRRGWRRVCVRSHHRHQREVRGPKSRGCRRFANHDSVSERASGSAIAFSTQQARTG